MDAVTDAVKKVAGVLAAKAFRLMRLKVTVAADYPEGAKEVPTDYNYLVNGPDSYLLSRPAAVSLD